MKKDILTRITPESVKERMLQKLEKEQRPAEQIHFIREKINQLFSQPGWFEEMVQKLTRA